MFIGIYFVVIFIVDRIFFLFQVIVIYIFLGFEYILLGVDYLLFVFGLMWLVNSICMLFYIIIVFIVVYSVMFVVVILGWIGVEEKLVNVVIVFSIVIIVVEVVKYWQGKFSFSVCFFWFIVLVFGLLYGFGFFGVFMSIGLFLENFLVALLFFNIGVELGQFCFVFLILVLIWVYCNFQVCFFLWSIIVVFYVIGIIGVYWFYFCFDILINSV